MQILSKFCHKKHLTRLYDNYVLSRYFTHHNAQMHCDGLQCYIYFKKTGSYSQENIIINSKANKYQQN